MRDAEVAGREAVRAGRAIDPGRIGVADQAVETGVLHHDHEDVLEVLEIAAIPRIRRRYRTAHERHQRSGQHSG
jgi:hypothetical protein